MTCPSSGLGLCSASRQWSCLCYRYCPLEEGHVAQQASWGFSCLPNDRQCTCFQHPTVRPAVYTSTNINLHAVILLSDCLQVLQPNDIFPSIKAALSSSSDFSTLRGVVNTIDTGLSIDLASMLEQISGTFAVPNNQASAAAVGCS